MVCPIPILPPPSLRNPPVWKPAVLHHHSYRVLGSKLPSYLLCVFSLLPFPLFPLFPLPSISLSLISHLLSYCHFAHCSRVWGGSLIVDGGNLCSLPRLICFTYGELRHREDASVEVEELGFEHRI